MEKINEDALAWTMRIHAAGLDVQAVITESGDVAEFLAKRVQRPEWSDVAHFAEMAAERDRARETAVRLEQELAESERKRIEDGTKLATYELEADNLIKGVLMEVRRAGSQKPAPEWAAVCDVVARAAQKFGVEL